MAIHKKTSILKSRKFYYQPGSMFVGWEKSWWEKIGSVSSMAFLKKILKSECMCQTEQEKQESTLVWPWQLRSFGLKKPLYLETRTNFVPPGIRINVLKTKISRCIFSFPFERQCICSAFDKFAPPPPTDGRSYGWIQQYTRGSHVAKNDTRNYRVSVYGKIEESIGLPPNPAQSFH